MAPILLAPSDDHDALRAAIDLATSQGVPLRLLPGTHFTRPGYGSAQPIEIGSNGLDLSGDLQAGAAAMIKRPDHAIDPDRPDFNHGLFFVPAPPTEEELAGAEWRLHTDGAFEYTVLIRGRVSITDVTLDCNMGRQGLDSFPVQAAEHSAMLGLSGIRYNAGTSPSSVPRAVFVAFESVALRDMITLNGGYADDIWFSRGYFNPNVWRVDICRLRSGPRINGRRSTVGFSGVCQNVRIHHADIYKLEMEDTISTTYDERPRPADAFTPSAWELSDLATDRIDLAAKGKVYQLDARRLTAKVAFNLYQAAGVIRDSTLRVGNERRLIRLNHFTFQDVTWIFETDQAGVVSGLKPTPQYGDSCEVAFLGNTFTVEGQPTSGEILTSEYSRTEPENRVNVIAAGCHYPDGFGNEPDRPIARVRQRGVWTFAESDLDGRDWDTALPKGPQSDVELKRL